MNWCLDRGGRPQWFFARTKPGNTRWDVSLESAFAREFGRRRCSASSFRFPLSRRVR